MSTTAKNPNVYAALPTKKDNMWRCNVYTYGVRQVHRGSAATVFTLWVNSFNCNDIFRAPNGGKK